MASTRKLGLPQYLKEEEMQTIPIVLNPAHSSIRRSTSCLLVLPLLTYKLQKQPKHNYILTADNPVDANTYQVSTFSNDDDMIIPNYDIRDNIVNTTFPLTPLHNVPHIYL